MAQIPPQANSAAELPVLAELSCPNCQSPLRQYVAGSKTIVCPACQSHVFIGGETVNFDAGNSLKPAPLPIELGDQATFENEKFVVLGRIAYEGWDPEDSSDTWIWNEWLLASTTGQLRWLEYDDEDGFVLSTKIRIRQAFDVQADELIPLGNNKSARVKERYPAKVLGAQGELTSLIHCGDRVTIIDAVNNSQPFSVEANDSEIELFQGRRLNQAQVFAAFGKQETITKKVSSQATNPKVIAVIFLLFAIVGLVWFSSAGSAGSFIDSKTIVLNTENPSASVNFAVKNQRPVQVIAKLNQPLPNNAVIEMDTILRSPNESETLLIDHDFFHEEGIETGYDEGEYYSESYNESDYLAENTFIPNQTGNYEVTVTWTPIPEPNTIEIEVKVYSDRQASGWLLAFGLICGAIAILIFAAPAIRRKLNL